MFHHVYLRLIVFTLGTLLPLFWIVVILGYRRQRNFERVFFFLCLALVFFFGASLLALNAQLHYNVIPGPLAGFCWVAVCLGLWFLPSLLLHLHVEYAGVRELVVSRTRKWFWLGTAWLPAVVLLPSLYAALRVSGQVDFVAPTNRLGLAFRVWLVVAVLLSVGWQWRFAKEAPDQQQRRFHGTLISNLLLVAILFVVAHALGRMNESMEIAYTTAVGLFALLPLAALIRNVQQFNFLQIGRQRNLIYAVFAAFLALLYLSFVRRVSLWMEPFLPPEASAAILLFLPVVFFEPLQRLVGRILQRTAHGEMERVQRLMAEIQQEARQGDLLGLARFVERRVKETFEPAGVMVRFWKEREINAEAQALATAAGMGALTRGNPSVAFSEGRLAGVFLTLGSNLVGSLRVEPHGAGLSGETRAALELLCEQLPGAIDLCRLIEEKLQLERELAERERLALVGQTAASISHNLKNPLGSIKTILQVQLERPEMPESMRAETQMILEEIGRLSAKLNQLLQFSRPAVRGGGGAGWCDARVVVEEVSAVLRHEAERRGVTLDIATGDKPIEVAGSAEALNDIVSNLLVNALEATPSGGRVRIVAGAEGATCRLTVEDDGAGIAEAARERILQPFFTTKAQGTGLGLAIVARRVAEFGGRLEWQSPVKDGRGTRFEVRVAMKDGEGG